MDTLIDLVSDLLTEVRDLNEKLDRMESQLDAIGSDLQNIELNTDR